jgi:hypothetical protein
MVYVCIPDRFVVKFRADYHLKTWRAAYEKKSILSPQTERPVTPNISPKQRLGALFYRL